MAYIYEQGESPDAVVDKFLDDLDEIDDCSGFIGWVGRENGQSQMVCAASPMQIAALIHELQKILTVVAGPTKDDTIQ